MPRWPLAGVALALAAAACGQAGGGGGGGGGSLFACTLIGCGAAVTVTVDQAGERPLEACVGNVCSPPGAPSPMIQDVPLGDSVEVIVRVSGGGDEVARTTATPTRSRPNGEGCEPECRAVRLRLTVDDQLVPA